MSSDSDVMHALTAYINADPEARAWLNGTPDPWGMVVNPAYKGIKLPVDNWPLLDQHLLQSNTGANQCLERNPIPWLPLVAAPVSNPAAIALNLQFDIANSQVNCKNNGDITQKLTGIGRENPGERFLIGLVSLADAARYRLDTAKLQTQNASDDQGEFDDASGRSFAAPDDAGLAAAAKLLQPDDAAGSWTLPYGAMTTDPAGKAAYPGTLLISADIPTEGLPEGDAGRLAAFLRFTAGAGQHPGSGNGDLPDGYLPLTAGNGLGAEVRYTTVAAEHVAVQSGLVPSLENPKAPPAPPAHPGGGTAGSSTPAASSGPSVIVATSSPTAAASSPPAKSTAPSSAPVTISPVPAAKTGRLSGEPLGLALPVLAVLGAFALATAAWVSGVGRRR
jgi:hypothetical protein